MSFYVRFGAENSLMSCRLMWNIYLQRLIFFGVFCRCTTILYYVIASCIPILCERSTVSPFFWDSISDWLVTGPNRLVRSAMSSSYLLISIFEGMSLQVWTTRSGLFLKKKHNRFWGSNSSSCVYNARILSNLPSPIPPTLLKTGSYCVARVHG